MQLVVEIRNVKGRALVTDCTDCRYSQRAVDTHRDIILTCTSLTDSVLSDIPPFDRYTPLRPQIPHPCSYGAKPVSGNTLKIVKMTGDSTFTVPSKTTGQLTDKLPGRKSYGRNVFDDANYISVRLQKFVCVFNAYCCAILCIKQYQIHPI